MSSGTIMFSCPKPKISDSRDEMIERPEKLNDSDEFEFDISPVEKDLKNTLMSFKLIFLLWRQIFYTRRGVVDIN